MNRSLPLFFAVFATVACVPTAHADLDSLLGDWVDAANSETESNSASDLSLTSAAQVGELEMVSSPSLTSEADPLSLDDTPDEAGEATSLTGHHAGSGSSVGHQHLHAPHNLYAAPTPSINPYVGQASGGCGQPSCGQASCNSGSCGCQSGCGELLDRQDDCRKVGQSECRPHRSPVLPPPSTFLQLFRSRNSYSAVWEGYADETRERCRNRSPHLDGTWRCQGCDNLLEPGQVTCSGGCKIKRPAASCQGGCGELIEPCPAPCDSGCDR
ncbi:hypothetical protein SAMN06265222_1095 [Neorhodopirellula lusitana]|uniref:Uncharacterized protein n=1 Tax=Neorhodopirellula lusitana TaxID=445327 RepID=A0ABY1QAJ9_9BACT|nr:hypothetical protein [Neorhodopirellula lusitana]SMP65206.1 hypothetical protein SAMN06265222_1095 [Neorhodopirellula lusitana]